MSRDRRFRLLVTCRYLFAVRLQVLRWRPAGSISGEQALPARP